MKKKNCHGFKSRIVIAVFLLFSGTAVFAQQVSLGTDIWPPYEDLENPAATGYCTELVVKAMESLGREAVITTYPWSRGLQLLDRGSLDGLFSGFYTTARGNAYLIPDEPLATLSFVLFGPIETDSAESVQPVETVETIEDLAGLRIGIVAGQEFSEENQRLFEDLAVTFVMNNSNKENLESVGNGTADYAVLELGIGLTWLKALDLEDSIQVLPSPVVETEKLYLFLNPDSFTEEEGQAVSLFLKDFKASPEGKILFKKYFY